MKTYARFFVRALQSLSHRSLLVSVLIALGIISAALAQEPQLIPEPREIRTNAHRFRLGLNVEIVLIPPAAPEDDRAARSLQDELEQDTGRKFVIESSPPPQGTPAILLGRLDQPLLHSFLRGEGLSSTGIGEQGYVLDVEPNRVVVAGKDGAGLFYGVQTLRQLIVNTGQDAEILGVQVRDWPSLRYRGTQVDMARGPVATLSYLKRIVDTISAFKLNQLNLYMEDSFRLEGQPLVGLLSDTLSHEELQELVAYAAEHYVDVIPGQNSCGHMHKILRFELYASLAERPHGYVMAPVPEAKSFLESLYAQMIPVFPAKFYNVGCDETDELGWGKSAVHVKQEGFAKIYLEMLLRLHEFLRSQNKQMIFWGDMVLRYPELLKSLPKDMIAASWIYAVRPDYSPWLQPFVAAGLRIIVAPAASDHLIVPDYEAIAANIQGFVNAGKKAGVIGMNNTEWGGGESLYGLNWWATVYGAACAWEAGRTPVADFDQKFDWAFYRNGDHQFVTATKSLGRINVMLRTAGIGQAEHRLFWQDPFSPAGQEVVRKAQPVAAQIRRTAEDAYEALSQTSVSERNIDTLTYLRFAALKLDALAMRYQLIHEISVGYANALANQHGKSRHIAENELSEIIDIDGRLADLRDYTTRLEELYKRLWLSDYLPNWLPNTLTLYDQQRTMWQEKIETFQQIRRNFEEGKALPPAESLGLIHEEPTLK